MTSHSYFYIYWPVSLFFSFILATWDNGENVNPLRSTVKFDIYIYTYYYFFFHRMVLKRFYNNEDANHISNKKFSRRSFFGRTSSFLSHSHFHSIRWHEPSNGMLSLSAVYATGSYTNISRWHMIQFVAAVLLFSFCPFARCNNFISFFFFSFCCCCCWFQTEPSRATLN